MRGRFVDWLKESENHIAEATWYIYDNGFRSLLELGVGITFEQRVTGVRKVSSKSAPCLRHIFVRRLMGAGIDDGVPMELARLASKEANRTDTKADPDTLQRAVEAMP